MKIKSSVVLISLLILSMIGGGLATGFVGMTLGDEALKGVRQPENRPTKKIAGGTQSRVGRDAVQMLNEKEIVAKVKSKIYTETKTKANSNSKTKSQTNKSETPKRRKRAKVVKKSDE